MLTDSDPVMYSSVESWARGRLELSGLSGPLRSALSELVNELEAMRGTRAEFFLSVVMRTQALREEQLQDALICLLGQTDQHFELLIMLHEVPSTRAAELRALVDTYPSDFSRRVRFIDVSGGGRTRPLSESVEHLRGEYVAFFDDDDLLMGNWVEVFHDAARKAPGQLIRVNVATQMNQVEIWESGAHGQRTTGVASAEYAKQYNFVDHIERNHTPFMGMAFPTSFFTHWGERFDELLPVCEDWDVALRAASLVGVYSAADLTAIYRQWEDAKTSYTSHQLEVWHEAENRVRDKVNRRPFFAPQGFVPAVLEVLGRERKVEHELGRRLNDVLGSTTWRATEPFRRVVRAWQRVRGGSNRR